jgi:transposase
MRDFLTPAQKAEYKRQHKKVRKLREGDRIKAILLLNNGYSYEETAEVLLIDDGTVRRWYNVYETGGIKTLLEDNYTGGISKLTTSEQLELSSHVEDHLYLTAKEICAYVHTKYEIEYTAKGMTSLLHQMGFSYKKPKHIPGKANQKAQEEFIEKYNELKANKSPEDQIYFMDGVHQLHNSQPAYGWIKKGKEQPLKTNTGRMRVNINGAYNIEEHKVIIRDDESINSQSTIALLEQMIKEQPLGILYIILDNAKYYRSQLVKDFLGNNKRIQFVFLPPYSPNLNIIERLWRFFKKKTTYNKYYEKFAVFKEKCLDFFENINDYKSELESLMTENFQLIQA